jgi:hypothetical protein
MAYRVRRRHQRLPTSLVIESAVNISAQFRFAASALPMNASDYTTTDPLSRSAFT